MSRRFNRRRRRKKAVFWTVTLLTTLAIMEVLSYHGLRLFDGKAVLWPIAPTQIDNWIRWANSGPGRGWVSPPINGIVFDRGLGWDHTPPVRATPGLVPGQPLFAASYGDSFTHCDEVKANETWQVYHQQETGRSILNLGTMAMGLDQAILKLKQYHARYPAPVVILGFFSDNIRRNAGVVGSFYMANPNFIVKPRFVPAEAGGFQLYNLMDDVKELKVGEYGWLDGLVHRDYWYHQLRRQFGFDALRGRRFPYTLEAASLGLGMVLHGTQINGPHEVLQKPDSEPMQVTYYLLKLFKQLSVELDFSPFILLHADRFDLGEAAAADKLEELPRAVGIPFMNVAALLTERLHTKVVKFEELFAPMGHYSARTNRMVAQALAPHLVRLTPRLGSRNSPSTSSQVTALTASPAVSSGGQ